MSLFLVNIRYSHFSDHYLAYLSLVKVVGSQIQSKTNYKLPMVNFTVGLIIIIIILQKKKKTLKPKN